MGQDLTKGSNVGAGNLLNRMLTSPPEKNLKGDLVVEPDQAADPQDNFAAKLEQTLRETEQAVLTLSAAGLDATQAKSWEKARNIVEAFSPVPWFIWRLSNFVFGHSDSIPAISEGMVFGLRRLLFASASDSVIGVGQKVNDVKKALTILSPDVIAAVAVIHAVCRKLASKPFDRIWRPILDDALLRARIGFSVGMQEPRFGPGRGMLAGFAGRSGLTILISSGDLDQARQTLERLATGALIKQVGMLTYKVDPLQVSAMALSAAGCGRDAAFGTVSYASEDPFKMVENDHQRKWLAAFTICEGVRVGDFADIDERHWESLGYKTSEAKTTLAEEAKRLTRRGHGWHWLG